MNTVKKVGVGEWVKSVITGQEGLVTSFNPFTGFFSIEAEDGSMWVDQADFLYVVD